MKIIAKKVVESSRFDVINHSDILKLVEKGYCVYVKMAEKSNLELFEMGVFYPRSARIITLLGNEVKIYKFNNSIDTEYTICFDNLEVGTKIIVGTCIGFITNKHYKGGRLKYRIRLISSSLESVVEDIVYTERDLLMDNSYIILEEE